MLWLYNISILKVIAHRFKSPKSIKGGGCRSTKNIVVEIGPDTSLNTETPKYLQPTINLLTP